MFNYTFSHIFPHTVHSLCKLCFIVLSVSDNSYQHHANKFNTMANCHLFGAIFLDVNLKGVWPKQQGFSFLLLNFYMNPKLNKDMNLN